MVGFALSNNPVIAGTGKEILIRGHLKLPALPEGALPGQPLYLDASVTGAVTNTPPSTSGNIVRAVGHLVGGPSLDPEQGYMFLNPDITYLQANQTNILNLSANQDYFIGINEPCIASVINRCIKKICDLQLEIASNMQTKLTKQLRDISSI